MRRDAKSRNTAKALRRAYELMRGHYGHLHWWPGETPFEVCVGAILTQNTSWQNVERAIANLKISPQAFCSTQNRSRLLLLAQVAVPQLPCPAVALGWYRGHALE